MSERRPDEADEGQEDQDRVSLHPLDPEEALRGLLKVDPESEPDEDEDPASRSD